MNLEEAPDPLLESLELILLDPASPLEPAILLLGSRRHDARNLVQSNPIETMKLMVAASNRTLTATKLQLLRDVVDRILRICESELSHASASEPGAPDTGRIADACTYALIRLR